MVYMFNELSIQKVSSKKIAVEILEQFIGTVVAANELGLKELRLFEGAIRNLYQLDICDNYNIDAWLKDPDVSSDLKDTFRDLLTSSPLITVAETEYNERFSWSEFNVTFQEVVCRVYGMGAAHIYETLAVSLKTDAYWEQTEISLSRRYLNDVGDSLTEKSTIRHFCDLTTLNYHKAWWGKKQKESLEASQELWNRREEFFPHLIFCREIEKQLQRIGVSKMLSQIIDRLRVLDDYSSKWVEGDFNYEDVNNSTNLRISPESDSTLRLHGTQRKFTIPGEGKKVFDLHIKTGDLRFHFYPQNETKWIYIGYIGKHLRIASQG